MIQEAEKIVKYYETRTTQFKKLEQAILEFDVGDTGMWMWNYLFEYAILKEEADKMFDLLDDKTIDMLAGFKVSFVIGIADEQG